MRNWTCVSEGPWSKRRKHQCVVWNDKILILGGFDGQDAFDLNDVWTWDGARWTQINEHAGWSGRDGHCAVVMNGAVYVFGGTDDPYYCKRDVWRSSDGGYTWDMLCYEAPWPERWQHAACVHDGKIVMTGGWGERYLNDVWSSSDGINWIQICANAPWRPRMFHSAISFDGAIYIIGGHDGHMQLRDVWASSDGGMTWTQVCQTAQWEGRQGHSTITLGGYVYIMGGFGGSTRFNDLWKSKDCAHWTAVSKTCPWTARQGHASISYRGNIVIVGGFGEDGYCNDMHCLNILNTESMVTDGDLHCASTESNGVDRLSNHSAHASPVKKTITVSQISVLESIHQLRKRRQSREQLITALLCVIGFVSEAVHHNTITEEDDPVHGSMNNEGNVGTPDIKVGEKRRLKSPSFDNLSVQNNESWRGDGAKSQGNNVPFGRLMDMVKKGSPLRECLLSLSQGSLRKGMPRVTSDDELRMNFWRMIPQSVFRGSSSSKDGQADTPLSPNSFGIRSRLRSQSNMSQSSVSTGNSPRILISKHASVGEETKAATDALPMETCGPMPLGASAALRDTMEREKKRLAQIQRNIRNHAEQGNDVEVDALIEERSLLADDATVDAESLMRHVQRVKGWQEARSGHLARMLTRMESLRVLTDDAQMIQLQNLAMSSPQAATAPAASPQKAADPQTAGASGLSSDAHEVQLTTWAEWEMVVRSCIEAVQAVDTSVAEGAIAEYGESMRDQAKHAVNIADWLGQEQTGSGNTSSRGDSARDVSLSGASATMSLLGSTPETLMRSTPDKQMNTVHDSNDSAEMENDDNFFLLAVDSCHEEYVLMQQDKPQIASLASDYDDMMEKIDRCKMAAKTAIDDEMGRISDLAASTKGLLKTSLDRGCGLVKNMIAQNRLDNLEIGSMEKEVAEWITTVQRLKDRVSLQEKCDELVAENSAKEEYLLRLEDERIDVKSMLEKASIKSTRKLAQQRGLRKRESGSDLGSSRDSNSPTNVHSPKDDTTNDEVEEKKKKLIIAEKAVANARRDMRSWYRTVRVFALTYAPELFGLIMDLQSPGSILGDGGFADNAKLPRRRLEEYADVAPLAEYLKGTNSTKEIYEAAAKVGRHVLLTAKLQGEDVVLKGFIMHEGEQRKALERELSILGQLRNDSVICPQAIVEDFIYDNPSLVPVAVYIQYPLYKGGNLEGWLKKAERKPWELQSIARQLLYGLMYLHDHAVVHKGISPSNILMHEDGRVVFANFEFSSKVTGKESSSSIEDDDAMRSAASRVSGGGFLAPEVESRDSAGTASDIYSFGMVLLYMHFPAPALAMIPGQTPLPANCDPILSDLLRNMLALTPATRPTAAAALMHPYFRTTFVERLLDEGEVVEQSKKLEAVRSLLDNTRSENRTNLDRLTIRRETVVEDILQYFIDAPLSKMRCMLRVIFTGEVGVDEGGLLTEMFSIFFEAIFRGQCGLFVGSESTEGTGNADSQDDDVGGSGSSGLQKAVNHVVLPNAVDSSPKRLQQLRAFGRAMVKALYEGRRLGSRLCPSVFKFLTGTSPDIRDLQRFDPQAARSLQWILATVGVEEFGLHFESVGAPELGPLTDLNKAKFVRLTIDRTLVSSRQAHLQAIKLGFVEAMRALSEEAAPFMSLLSHTDWRVLLCGDTAITGQQVVAAFRFTGFNKKSMIPQWLKEIILSSSEDNLRQFLVFVTGSPSLSASSSSEGNVEINVRCQIRSGALPIAHTCFFHLDIPDYKTKDALQSKLIYAIQNATTFEIV